MANNAWKWVLGCGIGCGAVMLILAALGVGGFFFVKDAVQGVVQEVERVEETQRALRERYGSVWEFSPQPDGTIPAERVEAFLRVREIMKPTRDEMEQMLAVLSGEKLEGSESSGGGIGKVRAGMGLIPRIMGYFGARNEALLEGEMGPGEYQHLYTLVFYSFLAKSPDDGPPFQLVGDDDGRRWKSEFGSPSEADVREARLERTLRSANRRALAVLRNQLEALDETGPSPDQRGWREALAAEIAAMEAEPERLPWADGLPTEIARSLEPYRDRLEASYSELCNTLEMGLDDH
jgi:hypothetical protein